MANNLYRIEVQARVESPQIDGSCMIYTDGGFAFAKIHPVNIKATPKVDTVEVKHGRCEKSVMKDEWYGHIYTCQECKYQCMVDDGTGDEVAPNYCPNCGAKMDLK